MLGYDKSDLTGRPDNSGEIDNNGSSKITTAYLLEYNIEIYSQYF